MDLPEDLTLTPGQLLLIQEAIDKLEMIVQAKHQKVMEDKINHMAAGGGMTPSRQATFDREREKDIQETIEMKIILEKFTQKIEDTILVLNARMFEQAKIVHQALREASKTDPSLEAAVRELDALYEEAQRKQDPLKPDDHTSEQPEG